jgi:hypothetical protein
MRGLRGLQCARSDQGNGEFDPPMPQSQGWVVVISEKLQPPSDHDNRNQNEVMARSASYETTKSIRWKGYWSI